MTRTLVFTRTKHGADKVMKHLSTAGFTAAAIHGNKSQANRERALAGFKAGKILVLVATDIAARGIDVDGVSHVINYDLPHVPETYVHRIGRTARAGAGGSAIAFCTPEDRGLLRDIEKTIRQQVPVDGTCAGHEEHPDAGAHLRLEPGRQGQVRPREAASARARTATATMARRRWRRRAQAGQRQAPSGKPTAPAPSSRAAMAAAVARPSAPAAPAG